MYDLLIVNGRVMDGTGNPWFYADVAVTGDRIEAVGRLPREAARVIDADGLVVAPGFIDIHAHPDLTLFRGMSEDYKVRQGVTTELGGQCGITVAPLADETAPLLKSYVDFLTTEEVGWNWHSFGEYLTSAEGAELPHNYCFLVGLGTVRLAVMGFENRAPSAEELARMEELVEASMREGAFGVSSGLIYPPGIFAQTPELIALARAAARHGGFYATHLRDEGSRLMQSMHEAIEVAETAGCPLQISHHKAFGSPNFGKVKDSLALIEEKRRAGLDVTVDQYPYTAGKTTLTAAMPPWTHEGGVPKLLERLANPETRQRIAYELHQDDSWQNFILSDGWESVMIAQVKTEANRRWIGKRVTEMAAALGKEPDDAAMDLLLEEDASVAMIIFQMDEGDVRTVMSHPAMMVGTDGTRVGSFPHPRAMGTFSRVLGKYARDEGLLTMEEAVRKMTSMPARRIGLMSKGLLRAGMDADITVFDPASINETATYGNPNQYPVGIEYVVVNGGLAVDKGKYLGKALGRICRRGA